MILSSQRMRLAVALLATHSLLAGCVSRPPVAGPVREDPRVVSAVDAQPAPTKPRKTPTPIAPVVSPPKACANCPTPDPDFAPTTDEVPHGVEDTPDAVVVDEPKSRYGNPENYEALGEQYKVLPKVPKNYREKGRASWYGKKFHGRRTANGEIYDMFKMTAAHKTLPLPSFVRVTSKANGRSVVVRVNDRGPFHPGRIIDLSYAAAARLDLLHHGSVDVEIEALSAQQGKESVEAGRGKPRYLEVGRYADPIDALSIRDRLVKLGYSDSEFLQTASPSGDGVENILRIGPFASFSQLEAARVKLGLQEITAIPVAD